MKLKIFGYSLLVLSLFSCRNYIDPTGNLPLMSENNKYFVRPKSGDKIKLNVNQKSDIYYLITNSVRGTPFSLSCQTGTFTPTGFSDFASNYVIKNTQDTFDINGAISIDYPHKTEASDAIEMTLDEYIKRFNRNPLKGDLEPRIIGDFDSLTKGSYDEKNGLTSPLGDYVGSVFKYDGHTGICRLVKKAKIRTGEEKYLVIYVQDPAEVDWTLDDDYIKFIGDMFLTEGLDNDIYDKLTDFFGVYEEKYGTYEGVMEYATRNKNYASTFPNRRNTITIFIHNLSDGTNGVVRSITTSLGNYLAERVLINLANRGNDILGQLSTAAHEFQHCLFQGNFNENFVKFFGIDAYSYNIDEKLSDETRAEEHINEILSGVTQMFLSKYIYDLKDSVPSDKSWYDSNPYEVIQTNYRAWFYKNYFDDNINIYKYDYENGNYFANYLLQNYGKKMMQKFYSNGAGNLDFFSVAINEVFPKANMTTSRLLADWHTSNMLTSIPDPSITYPYTPRGANLLEKLKGITNYNLGGLKVPVLTSFDKYRDGLVLPLCNTFKTYDGKIGDTVYSNISIQNSQQTIITRRVLKDVGPGVYEATAPELPEGVVLTVVAVPK